MHIIDVSFIAKSIPTARIDFYIGLYLKIRIFLVIFNFLAPPYFILIPIQSSIFDAKFHIVFSDFSDFYFYSFN